MTTPNSQGDTPPPKGNPPLYKSRRLLIWASGALILGGAVWGGSVYVQRTHRAMQKEAERMAKAQGGFKLSTQPPGASVTVASETQRTPSSFERQKIGTYHLQIALEDYEPVETSVCVKENQITDLGEIPLVKSRGSLDILTPVEGAVFEVSNAEFGKQTGSAPHRVEGLAVGSYLVTLKRPGWLPYQQTVRVRRNATASVSWDFGPETQLTNDLIRQIENRAKNLVSRNQYAEALELYEAILAADPKNQLVLSNAGVVCLNQEKWDEAEKFLKTALALDPKDSFSLSMLGIVQSRKGQDDDAIATLTSALNLGVTNSQVHHHLGMTYMKKGNMVGAEKELMEAIGLKPGYAEANYNLALVLARQKPPSVERARRHYKKALEGGFSKDEELENLIQRLSGK